jgi:hypothetical protein
MTCVLVALLGMFNSLRPAHNWFASRVAGTHIIYPWVLFPDDTIRQKKLYLDSTNSAHNNAYRWAEFKKILVSEFKGTFNLPEEMPRHLTFKFPEYLIENDSIKLEYIDKEEISIVLAYCSKLTVVSRAELNDLLTIYDRARIENTVLIKMPILGITFDVNWLGLVSSVAFSIVFFLLYYSLSRERKNLILVFKLAQERGMKRIDFYQMLSMRQVLHVPKSVDQFAFKNVVIEKPESKWQQYTKSLTNQMGMYPLFTPLVVWLFIFAHDLSTFTTGLSINATLTWISTGLSLLGMCVMSFLVYLCWGEWRLIIQTWDEQSKIIEKEYEQMEPQ